MEKRNKKVGFLLLLIVLLVAIGFYPSYFKLFPGFNEHIDVLVHLHFFISALWIATIVTQPILIALHCSFNLFHCI